MPSLVAEIGDVLERHLKFIGLMDDGLDEHQQQFIAQKKLSLNSCMRQNKRQPIVMTVQKNTPAGSQLCSKCHTQAAVQMDGCLTCLACGDSKCG